ncbi:torsin-1A-interacting protein 2 isoform X2 [Engraulis encrasicolus]|uniref:torsin-1A-interacting protein 2 isoform X2 n=1 Tax=Engraulis encrasicolus TaxID=184585 RepID=UPI002FCF0184
MASGDDQSGTADPPNRRLTRQSAKDFPPLLTPRDPLKRTRKDADHPTTINGSDAKERRPSTDSDEPPKKRRSMQSGEEEGEATSGSEVDMESDADGGDGSESDEDGEMSSGGQKKVSPRKLIKRSSVRLEPLKGMPLHASSVLVSDLVEPELRHRTAIRQGPASAGMDGEALKHSTESSKRGSGTSLHVPIGVQNYASTETYSRSRHGVPATRPTEAQRQKRVKGQGGVSTAKPPDHQTIQSTMQQYQQRMREGLPPRDSRQSHGTHPVVQDLSKSRRTGGIPVQNQNNVSVKKDPPRKTGKREAQNAKTNIPSSGGGAASGLYTLILWLFLLCSLLAVGVLAYQRMPWSSLYQRLRHRSTPSSPVQEATVSTFSGHMRALQQHFPSQREELWRRTQIHLQRHLGAAQPSEPVSFILAGGRGAEATLGCLARRLASAFSTALNGSALELDGSRMAGMDSDQVKLELDTKLKEAFEGDKPAAVIHRLEELPPSSSLIFYRYCDHENAAYKHPLLAFTVLLPLDTVGPDVSLPQVEELVHGHIHQKFLIPDQRDTFDKMDVDKLSGLWSRISHLILPVEAEEHVEKGGCERD